MKNEIKCIKSFHLFILDYESDEKQFEPLKLRNAKNLFVTINYLLRQCEIAHRMPDSPG